MSLIVCCWLFVVVIFVVVRCLVLVVVCCVLLFVVCRLLFVVYCLFVVRQNTRGRPHPLKRSLGSGGATFHFAVWDLGFDPRSSSRLIYWGGSKPNFTEADPNQITCRF